MARLLLPGRQMTPHSFPNRRTAGRGLGPGALLPLLLLPLNLSRGSFEVSGLCIADAATKQLIHQQELDNQLWEQDAVGHKHTHKQGSTIKDISNIYYIFDI